MGKKKGWSKAVLEAALTHLGLRKRDPAMYREQLARAEFWWDRVRANGRLQERRTRRAGAPAGLRIFDELHTT